MSGTGNDAMQLALLEGVHRAVRAGIIVFDAEERIVLWNRWMEQHSHLPPDIMLGRRLTEVFPDMADSRAHVAIQAALQHNFASLLSQTLNKAPFPLYPNLADAVHGIRIQQAVHVVPLEISAATRHCLVQITDVSAAVARERKLRAMALELESLTLVDGLTGIANRRHFDLHLEDEFRRAKRKGSPVSLIMVDVDYFKNYNDNYGHQQGDESLTRIASALCRVPHRPRDLVTRYGGEEFAVILPDTDADGALQVAQAMRATVEELAIEHAYTRSSPYVTISAGVGTLVPDQAAKTGALLYKADHALYQAKRKGRNCVAVYTDSNKR